MCGLVFAAQALKSSNSNVIFLSKNCYISLEGCSKQIIDYSLCYFCQLPIKIIKCLLWKHMLPDVTTSSDFNISLRLLFLYYVKLLAISFKTEKCDIRKTKADEKFNSQKHVWNIIHNWWLCLSIQQLPMALLRSDLDANRKWSCWNMPDGSRSYLLAQ